MTPKEQQLTELLTLTSRNIAHLTAAITSLSFDLLRSSDPGVRGAGTRMIVRMQAVSEELDQQWSLIAELTGVEPPARVDSVVEVQMPSAS